MGNRMTPSRCQSLGGLILLAAAFGAWPSAATEPPLTLGLPVSCVPGESCWIVNYVDHDPGPGVRDYACGQATYNEPGTNAHNGTDFAIRDGRAMRRGVAVLAAADGVVTAMRDGEADADITSGAKPAPDGKECGNGVVIDHGNSWETQYCHLRQDSVAVAPRRRVRAGEKLGLVGLSGFTQFPHLHMTVRQPARPSTPSSGPFVHRSAARARPRCGMPRRWPRCLTRSTSFTTPDSLPRNRLPGRPATASIGPRRWPAPFPPWCCGPTFSTCGPAIAWC
jgi:murein DD-endopeptidase MepM/ murein hydrolase activator NlpD